MTGHVPRSPQPLVECEVCAHCGGLFDDTGDSTGWLRVGREEEGWRHACRPRRRAVIVVRRLTRAELDRRLAATA